MDPRNLRDIRADHDISQEELAELAGCTRSVISHAEHPEWGCSIRYSSALRILAAINDVRREYGWEPVCLSHFTWHVCRQDGKPLSPSSTTLAGVIEASGLTIEQVASRAGLSTRVISKAGASSETVRLATRDQLLAAINALRAEQGLCPIAQEAFPVRIRDRDYAKMRN